MSHSMISKSKDYSSKDFQGDMEITGMTGNISMLDDELIVHSHITFSDTEYRSFGGHLNEMKISATLEIMLFPLDVDLKRSKDSSTNINLLDL